MHRIQNENVPAEHSWYSTFEYSIYLVDLLQSKIRTNREKNVWTEASFNYPAAKVGWAEWYQQRFPFDQNKKFIRQENVLQIKIE